MKLFVIFISIILLALGFKYIDGYFFLYSVFILLTARILWHFCNVKDIRRNILYVFVFSGWIIYTGLGFVRQGYMAQQSMASEANNNLFLIYLVYILSTLLLFMPIKYMQDKKIKGFGRVVNQLMPDNKCVFLLIFASIGLSVFQIYLAGGWHNFVYAAYGQKTDSSYLTFFNLFSGIATNTLYLILPVLCFYTKSSIKILAVVYFIFSIVMGSINGSSLSIFNPLLALFTFKYLTTHDSYKKRKLKKYFVMALIAGVVGGILIRQNRSDNENFSFNVLDNAMEDVLMSSTFDNITNLQKILDLSPQGSVGQFIYPYVNYLPRSVFPWKPMEMGRIISYKFKDMDEDKFIGFLPSPIGEFYYDFGFLGVIIGMLFVGFVLGWLQEKMNRTYNSSILLWGYFVGLCIYSTIYSGWYTGCFIRFVRLFIFIFLVYCLNYLFRYKKHSYDIQRIHKT